MHALEEGQHEEKIIKHDFELIFIARLVNVSFGELFAILSDKSLSKVCQIIKHI